MEAPFHDEILLEGLKEGNVKIFDYLFHYYYSGLVVFSSRFVENAEVAEDIVQDFFFKLWINRRKLVIRQSLKSYFFSAIKNRSIDFLKREKNGKKVKTEIAYIQESDNENLFVESELEELINNAIEKLPEKCKHIFLMNRFQGIKPAEIAEIEHISVRTVEGHIGKAIRLLRSELSPYLPASLILILLKDGMNF